MLYVFLVDTGRMLAFDMNLALESVSKLKEDIAKTCDIPADKQVLLISGGESLDPDVRVCSYSAGTDTNPIFLFSKGTIESVFPPALSVGYNSGTEVGLKAQVEDSLTLPANFMTVLARTQLAQQIHDIARDQTRACEQLVHEQHLQQQGWAAVVANLEDITCSFKKRVELYDQNFAGYLESRELYIKLLEDFSSDLALLERIPVLRVLLEPEENDSGDGCRQPVTLREWICSKDNQSRLETVAEQCSRGLQQFDPKMCEALQVEVQQVLESVNNQTMKEVKGLEERLYRLDQLMYEARKVVQEQGELAQAFLHNQARAENLRDPTVLPALCDSHRKQLKVMLGNYQHLHDIHRRCVLAKEELSANLHARLRWIMFVERNMSELDSKLIIYYENLKRLRRSLEVAQQIHLGPVVYLSSVTEVARRKIYSENFMKWSKDVAGRVANVHAAEVMARQKFLSQVGNHFLCVLFPGLGDFPPPYASQPPEPFDTQLPDIRPCDVKALEDLLPELAFLLNVPEIATLPEVSRRISDMSSHETVGDEPEKMNLSQVTSNLVKSSSVPNEKCDVDDDDNKGPYLTDTGERKTVVQSEEAAEVTTTTATTTAATTPPDDREPEESEPDTEEFETLEGGTTDVVPFQEHEANENRLQLSDLEIQLRHLREIGGAAIEELRREVRETRNFVVQSKDDVVAHLVATATRMEEAMNTAWQSLNAKMEQELCDRLREADNNHQEMVNQMSQKLEVESQKLRDACEEIRTYQDQLRACNEVMDNLRLDMSAQLEELQRRLVAEHQEVVKSMTLEHELELESVKEDYGKKIEALECQLRESQTEVVNNVQELKLLEVTLNKRFRDENEKILAKYEEEFLERELQSVNRALAEAEMNFRSREERVHQDADRRVFEACEGLKKELQDGLERERLQLAEKVEREFEEKKEQLLREAREALAREHKQEMDGLRARFRLAFSTAQGMERSPSDTSLEKIGLSKGEDLPGSPKSEVESREVVIAAIRRAHRQEMEELQQSHHKELDGLRHRLEKVSQESLKAMKVSLTAERQVLFNEAIQHATCEKETVIQDLRMQVSHLQEELEHNRFLLLGSRSGAESEARGSSFSLASDRSEGSPTRSQPDSGNFQMVSPIMPRRTESSGVLNASVVVSPISEQPPAEAQGLDSKEEEMNQSDASLMASSGQAIQQDKVSVFTCSIGDLILLYYDERHENYLVFTLGSISHFLNHDCLEALNLVPGPGEPRKNWALAQVTEKEYCQARKEQNRFRVPLGTRFYRIRAKPWSREATLRRSTTTTSQMASSTRKKQQLSFSTRSSGPC